jgi:tetratricopeptide (TPR) repeat protein
VCAENLLRENLLEDALSAYQRALQSALAMDDRISVGITLANMSIAANALGKYQASGEYASRALAVFQALGSEYQQPFPRRMMAYAALHAKDYASARALSLESLHGNIAVASETGVLAALIALAETEAASGNMQQAARMVAFAKFHMEKEGRVLMRPDVLALARLDKILPEHFPAGELAGLQAKAAFWQLEQVLPG